MYTPYTSIPSNINASSEAPKYVAPTTTPINATPLIIVFKSALKYTVNDASASVLMSPVKKSVHDSSVGSISTHPLIHLFL